MLPTTQKCGPLKQQGANIFLSWNIQTKAFSLVFLFMRWLFPVNMSSWNLHFMKTVLYKNIIILLYLLFTEIKAFSLGFVFWEWHKSTSYTNGHRTWRNSGGETCLLLQYISTCIYYYRNNTFSPQQTSRTEQNGEAFSHNSHLSSISRRHTSLLSAVDCATLEPG